MRSAYFHCRWRVTAEKKRAFADGGRSERRVEKRGKAARAHDENDKALRAYIRHFSPFCRV